MCGIVGIVRSEKTDPEILVAMRDALRHRGPDDAGIWWSPEGLIGLAHRRLSIIDLSPAGHQPMLNSSGQLAIVFNGEIYNYRDLRHELEQQGLSFRSSSDTEVILAAYQTWGSACVSRLNGMFAFAIYDLTARRIFAARDRAGEKPFFYWHSGRELSFASELKALMADPGFNRRMDLDALEAYLTYGTVPGEMCMLAGTKKLPPAHALEFSVDTGNLKVWRYWQLPEAELNTASLDELADQLHALLKDSVQRQLIADVPVGILLSGGVDSSLITALATQASPRRVKTFTISFPGHGVFDESPYARQVAEHFGTEHTVLAAEPASVDLLPALARQYDEPMCDSSMIPTFIVSRLIRQHCTVALGGDGGDELFGGYLHYSHLQRQQTLRRYLPHVSRNLMATAAERMLPIGLRGRNYLLGVRGDLRAGIARVHTFFDPGSRRRLLRPLLHNGTKLKHRSESYKEGLCNPQLGLPGQAMAADFNSYLPDDILVKVDRASMLTSLEVRAPFLDYRIIEFAFRRVPNHFRATKTERKILPRHLAARHLPKELDLRRKQGFSLPLKEWFKGEWGTFITDVLCSSDSTLFDANVIRQLLTGQRKGYSNTERLFALSLLELWRREYRVAAP